MNIDFKESRESLTSRIKIHDLYGSANLDLWMFEKLKITSDEKILDLGYMTKKLTKKQFIDKKNVAFLIAFSSAISIS